MVPGFFSRRVLFIALALLLPVMAGCTTDNASFENSAPLPNLSPQPGLHSADTTNPLSGTGGVVGPGPLSPAGVNGVGGTANGGARGGH